MALSCGRARRISLAALGGHAAEPERLELEEHLHACAACGEQHGATLALVRRLADLPTEGLNAGARETVRQALVRLPAGATGARLAPSAARRARWVVPTLTVAAAAVVVAVTVGPGAGRRARLVAGPVAGVDSAPAVTVAGDVTVTVGRDADPEGPIVKTFRSAAGGRVQVPDARVEMHPATEMAWNGATRRVSLRHGRLTIDVQHRAGQRFEVRTPAFTVEVVGTRFTVDLGGVHTLRGVVQVVGPDGSIVARVEAGQRWTAAIPGGSDHAGDGALVPPPSSSTTVRSPSAPALSPSSPVVATEARAAKAPAMHQTTDQPTDRPMDLRLHRLVAARRALARGDATAARAIVARLFDLGGEAGAEARVLYAESFLVEGRYADAMDGYRRVVRDFSGTEQAESAEFAAAQLASEHGSKAEAERALGAYLRRHPGGRFAGEAAARLAQVAAGAP